MHLDAEKLTGGLREIVVTTSQQLSRGNKPMVASVATQATYTNTSCVTDPLPWALQTGRGDVHHVKTYHGAKSL